MSSMVEQALEALVREKDNEISDLANELSRLKSRCWDLATRVQSLSGADDDETRKIQEIKHEMFTIGGRQ